MQIRKIIEYKYPLFTKKICRKHKERKYGVLHPFLQNQERNTCGQGNNKNIEQEEKMEGRLSLKKKRGS